jgi:hypothetical protein
MHLTHSHRIDQIDMTVDQRRKRFVRSVPDILAQALSVIRSHLHQYIATAGQNPTRFHAITGMIRLNTEGRIRVEPSA